MWPVQSQLSITLAFVRNPAALVCSDNLGVAPASPMKPFVAHSRIWFPTERLDAIRDGDFLFAVPADSAVLRVNQLHAAPFTIIQIRLTAWLPPRRPIEHNTPSLTAETNHLRLISRRRDRHPIMDDEAVHICNRRYHTRHFAKNTKSLHCGH